MMHFQFTVVIKNPKLIIIAVSPSRCHFRGRKPEECSCDNVVTGQTCTAQA
jgi:hypothetical protein